MIVTWCGGCSYLVSLLPIVNSPAGIGIITMPVLLRTAPRRSRRAFSAGNAILCSHVSGAFASPGRVAGLTPTRSADDSTTRKPTSANR